MEKQQQKSNQAKFLKHIKMRIGEPITAVYVSSEGIGFGAISGYIGFYNYKSKQLNYIQQVYEEIIRGIFIKDANQIGNAVVGDFGVLEIDFNDLNNPDMLRMHEFENHKDKRPAVCASTISFLSKYSVAIFLAAPTQQREKEKDKDNAMIEEEKKEKKKIYIYTIYKEKYAAIKDGGEFMGDLDTFELPDVPDVYVPFDYDGQRLCWLEYAPEDIKYIQMLTLQKDKSVKYEKEILKFGKETKFISHMKVLKNLLIYVLEHTQVVAYDLNTKQTTALYKHNAVIQSIDAKRMENLCSQAQEMEIQQQITDEVEEIKEQDLEIKDISIATIDYDVNLTIFGNGKIEQQIPLLKQPDMPQDIKQAKYIFDMGYPYYISYRHNIIAFSSDFGILSFSI